MRNIYSRISLILLLAMAGTFRVSAQQTEDEPEEQPEEQQQADASQSSQQRTVEATSTSPIEEITVRGQQTLGSLRFLLKEAEDDMYAMFNELNSDDDFDIICDKVRRTGSYIRDRVCEPKFLKRERQSNSSFVMSQLQSANRNIANSGNGIDFSVLGDYLQDEDDLRSILSDRFEAMGEEMIRIASENPEFQKALMQISAYRQSFEAMREERFGN